MLRREIKKILLDLSYRYTYNCITSCLIFNLGNAAVGIRSDLVTEIQLTKYHSNTWLYGLLRIGFPAGTITGGKYVGLRRRLLVEKDQGSGEATGAWEKL